MPATDISPEDTTSPDDTTAENPLPACPDTPNCERETRSFSTDPDVLFGAVQATLASMGPVSMNVRPTDRSVHVVYRVALVFKDDVEVAIRPDGPSSDTSLLYIRSASRVGKSDLGVNRRRVNRFFRRLEERL